MSSQFHSEQSTFLEHRERELSEWGVRLKDEQRQLDTAAQRFRAEMKDCLEQIAKSQRSLNERVSEVSRREADVRRREDELQLATETLANQQRVFAALLDRERKEQERVQSSLEHFDPTSDTPTRGSVQVQGDSNSSARRVISVATTPPKVIGTQIPVLNFDGLVRGRSGGSPAAQLSGRGIVGASAVANRTPTTSRSVSPQMYEGPVDPSIPSHVEEIPSDDGNEQPAPRGLRSSPQFQPMDPNDSGLGFLRQRNEESASTATPQDRSLFDDDEDEAADEADEDGGDDTELQMQFDEAVSFLVSSGAASLGQIQQWMTDGADAQQIIELYLRAVGQAGSLEEEEEYVNSEDNAHDGGDGGDAHEHEDRQQHRFSSQQRYFDDDDGDEYFEDDDVEYEDEDDIGDTEDVVEQNAPITDDGAVLEDDDGESSSAHLVHHNSNRAQTGGDHNVSASSDNVSLTAGRVRGQAPNSPRHTSYNSFDEDSDEA